MNILKKIFLLVALSATSFSFAQESSETTNFAAATVDENYCIILDATSDIQDFYVADASALAWVSAAEALKKCGFHSNNLISFKADFENDQILIHLHTDRTYEDRDIVWWNDYLQSICN